MNPIYKSRRRSDIVIRALCVGAALFGVTWLALILITLVYNGLAGLSVQLFTQNTPPPGSTGSAGWMPSSRATAAMRMSLAVTAR